MASPEKPVHISQEDWDDADIPEISDEEFARAKPFSEVFPEVYAAWTRGRGRPPSETPKVHVGFRLAADVVSGIKATGRGYNARVEKVLRDALAKGQLEDASAPAAILARRRGPAAATLPRRKKTP